jgi:hypothetical protein
MTAYEERLARVRQQRRRSIALWRLSTGTQLAGPETERSSSVRVDVFGTLRGACARSGCRMWRRDLSQGAQGGWCDTTVLFCQDCRQSKDDHEDCGPYEEDPEPPRGASLDAIAIQGVNARMP